jgi:cholesterol transport system auxiliary component
MSKRTFSTDRRALLASGASLLVLSACSNIIGPPESAALYVLDPENSPARNGPALLWQLSVVLPETSDSLDTTRISLMMPAGQMDYYANANWQDRLPLLVQASLVEAFEATGRLTAVGRDSEGLKSDYLLLTDIRAFQARYDVADAPPKVEVRIVAKLVRALTRTIVQVIDAQSVVPVAQNSVPSVVAAMNQALSNVETQIVDWALRAPPPVHS